MAVTNLHEFTVAVRQHVEETKEAHRDRTRAAALYALQNLVLGTRVDTGRARGNWQAGEGSPPIGYDPERYDLAGRLGSRDTLADESTVILGATGEDIIWLHNGVPYIEHLENLDHMLLAAVESLRTWLDSRSEL